MLKRGLSTVVTSVLIIGMSVVLVTLLGVLVLNELSKTQQGENVVEGLTIKLNLPIDNIYVDQAQVLTKPATFILERRPGRGQMDGFIIVLDNDQGSSKTYRNFENVSLGELESRVFTFTHTTQGLVTYLRIVPLKRTAEGEQLIGGATVGQHIGPDGYAVAARPPLLIIQNNATNTTQEPPPIYDPLNQSGLISYFSFDSGHWQANRVFDQADINNYITTQGSVQQAQGIRGQGIAFNGQPAEALYKTATLGDHGAQDFTLLLWVKPNTYKDMMVIAAKGNIRPVGYPNDGWHQGYGLAFYEGVAYARLDEGTHKSEAARGAIREGIWHQIAMVRRGITVELYIDGNIVDSESSSISSINNLLDPLSLGARYCGNCGPIMGEYLDGSIDEVLMFNRPLSNQEINDNYRSLMPLNNRVQCDPNSFDFLWTTLGSPTIFNADWKNMHLSPYPFILHNSPGSQYIVTHGNSYSNRLPNGDIQYTYPHLTEDGQWVGGGIPQNANITAAKLNIQQWLTDQDNWYAIPPNYQGYIYMDYEGWPILWSQLNYTNPNAGISPYVTRSKDQVRTQHPSWTEAQITVEAERQWNEAAKNFTLEMFYEAKRLFPNAKIGFYGQPNAPIYRGYYSSYGDRQRAENDQLSWLWETIDYVSPSVYLSDGTNTQAEKELRDRQFIYGSLVEAKRIGDQYNKPVIPFTTYARYNSSNGALAVGYLNEESLRSSYEVPIALDVDATFMWGYESSLGPGNLGPTQGGRDQLEQYIASIMGPLVQQIKNNGCPQNQVL